MQPRTELRTELGAFAPAWLGGDRDARALLSGGFDSRDSRIAAVRVAASRRCDPALLDALATQHRELPPCAARQRHLDALDRGNAAVVVSGQQVGLFTGPAFTLYKAAGVIAAARRLTEESSLPCVPVFWLQTEDHDWPEIDHCLVRGRGNDAERIAVGDGGMPARLPVAARRFDTSIEDAFAGLDRALGAQPHAAEVIELLRRHYRSGTSPAAAFRGVLSELFAGDGLLFLDPRDAEVAALARPLLHRSLVEAEPLSALLARRSDAIEAAGLAVQVPVRPGAPLCFFHPDRASGPRYRLEPRGAGEPRSALEPGGQHWRLCDTDREVARDEALRILADDPLRFSSSALLRPLVQDHLLPTAMILGGPGEIAYFAELAPLYEALGVAMPLVAPRPSFCVTGAGDRRRLEALGLGFAEVAGDRDTLLARLAPASAAGNAEATLRAALDAALEEFAAEAIALDPTLLRPIEKARATIDHAVAKVTEKFRHSVLHRDTVLVERIDRLRAALAPHGVPQERSYGFASLAAEHGIAGLLEGIRRCIEPFAGATAEIAL